MTDRDVIGFAAAPPPPSELTERECTWADVVVKAAGVELEPIFPIEYAGPIRVPLKYGARLIVNGEVRDLTSGVIIINHVDESRG